MKFVQETVVFSEIPNEIALCYSISGCGGFCSGCHSQELWKEDETHKNLSTALLINKLNTYKGMITSICFLGGEWHLKEMVDLLKISKKYNLKTCLYTSRNNLEDIEMELLALLDFVKIGEYKKELGGLNSLNTNQRFLNVKTGECLNNLFKKKQKKEG